MGLTSPCKMCGKGIKHNPDTRRRKEYCYQCICKRQHMAGIKRRPPKKELRVGSHKAYETMILTYLRTTFSPRGIDSTAKFATQGLKNKGNFNG